MRDVVGYEGKYAITSCGKVWSYYSNKFIKQRKNEKGYWIVDLFDGSGKCKHKKVHRLIAEAYLPNPNGLPDAGHDDENKDHNYLSNVYWTEPKENNGRPKRRKKLRKPVYCIELDKVFESMSQAAEELGLTTGNISNCANGRSKIAGGYHFKLVEEN